MNIYQSDRLSFRAWDSTKDKDFYHSFHSDPTVFPNTWKGLPRPVTKDRIDSIIKHFEEAFLALVICKKPLSNPGQDKENIPESERIGVLTIKNIPSDLAHNRCGELGIELRREAQGQGYGTEAIRWGVNWAFQTANLHRIQLEVYEWNGNAVHAYKRVGFQEEGRLRKALWRDGRWWDEIIMGILQEECTG